MWGWIAENKLLSGLGTAIIMYFVVKYSNKTTQKEQAISTQDSSTPLNDLLPLINQIKTAPPLMRNDIAQKMIGIKVDLDCVYLSGYTQKDHIQLFLRHKGDNFNIVTCKVPLDTYPELKIMHEKTPIRVIGKISEIGPSETQLTDITLHFNINQNKY